MQKPGRALSIPIVSCVVFGTLLAAAANGTTYYVDYSATSGNKTGGSWPNAFLDIQSALNVAVFGDEIHVAEGVYKPSVNPDPNRRRFSIAGCPTICPEGACSSNSSACLTVSTCPCRPTGSQLFSFRLVNGVSMYGGYPSGSDNGRDVSKHETILSGDLNGDDIPPSDHLLRCMNKQLYDPDWSSGEVCSDLDEETDFFPNKIEMGIETGT